MKYPIQKKRRQFRLRNLKANGGVKKPIPRSVVPSFFTLMNLFSGFVSIVVVSQENYKMGAMLILLAALFDVFDGFMARLANATSEFGMELDSLSDVVSFGVAPAFLAYHLALSDLQFPGILISALPALCGAVRLARYNIDHRVEELPHFKGLPIPAQAVIIASLTMIFLGNVHWFDSLRQGMTSILLPLIVTLSFLMVSTIPFDKIPRFEKEAMRRQRGKVLLFSTYLVLIIAFREYGLIAAFTIFILKGVLLGIWSVFFEQIQSEGQ